MRQTIFRFKEHRLKTKASNATTVMSTREREREKKIVRKKLETKRKIYDVIESDKRSDNQIWILPKAFSSHVFFSIGEYYRHCAAIQMRLKWHCETT